MFFSSVRMKLVAVAPPCGEDIKNNNKSQTGSVPL